MMRKRFLAVFIAIISCLAVLSGCGLMSGMENDVYVVFEVDGQYVDGVTINSFNNAIAPEYDGTVPEGYKFMGWSAKSDWKFGDDKSLLISNGGIVRYEAVKDYLTEGGTAVVRPVIIDKSTIYKADLVIAWYSKTDTSNVSQSHMDSFETSLRAYLASEGYDVENMDIAIRGYNGNVGTSCENVRKDDDVDIMVGWGGNIKTTGGMTDEQVKENVDGVKIGETERYAARLTDSELTILVYAWIQNEYGKGVKEPPVIDPTITYDLVIAWYDNSISELTQDIMDAFKTNLVTYLATQDKTNLEIAIRGYSGDVATSCGNITTNGDVDIMVGWGANIKTTGKMTDEQVKENVDGVKISGKERYATRLTDSELTILVYEWIQNEYGKGVKEPPVIDPTVTYDLVVAWYDKSSTSGLTQEIMDTFKTNLIAYFASQGKTNLEIAIRAYDGDVVTSCGNITANGDVDIMVGWAGNIKTTGKMTDEQVKENVDGVKIGEIERYAARLTDSELCTLAYEWIKTEYGKTEEPPVVDPDPKPNPDVFTPDPNAQYKLVVGWYSKEGTSGLNSGIIDGFETALKTYLETYGFTMTNVTIELFDCGTGNVASVVTAVNGRGDVDILLGMKAIDLGDGAIKAEQEDVVMGAKTDRRIQRLTDSDISKLVFEWLKTDEARNLFKTA